MAYSWDRLGILGERKKKDFTGGIDYQGANSSNTLGTYKIDTGVNNGGSDNQNSYNDMFIDAQSNPLKSALDNHNKSTSGTGIDSKDINTGIFTPISRAENDLVNSKLYQDIANSSVGKFLSRFSNAGGDALTFGQTGNQTIDTGNGVSNFLADALGFGVGLMVNPGGMSSLGQKLENTIGKPIEKGASKLLGDSVLGQYGTKGVKSAAEFAVLNSMDTAAQGGNLKDIGKSALEGSGQGALWGIGGKALGDAFTHFIPKLGKIKITSDDGQTVTFHDENGNTQSIDKATFDSTAKPITQETIDSINSSNNLENYSARELLAAKKYNNNIKNSMDNLGYNSDIVNNEIINNELNNRLGKSGTTYAVKNTASEQAANDYEYAINAIHNYFGTNKLTLDEMTRIKPELGIDLDQLINNIETAKTDVRAIGERQRLRKIAGVDNTTFNPITETTTEQIPYVKTLRQPKATEQVPSVMVYKEKVPVENQETVQDINKIDAPLTTSETEQNKLTDLNSMTKEELFKAISETPLYKTYRPTATTMDWGEGKARGQGKRVGDMVMGGMGDAPQGKKNYVNLVGGVPEFKTNPDDFKGMSELDKTNYLKAREFGLNHNQAMVYQFAKNDSKDLTNEHIMNRFKHYEDSKSINNQPSQNAPLEDITHKVNDEVMLNHNGLIDAGTIKKINDDGTYEIQRPEGDYALAKKNGDNFESLQSTPTSKEDLTLDDRTNQNVGNRKIKSYQYLHPELKSHIQEEANVMLGELKDTQKASRYVVDANGEAKPIGEQRITSDDIAYLRDTVGMSYADIEKGLNKLIEDDGSENNASSKKIELVIDHRLSNGYNEFHTATNVEPNKEYISKKNAIEGQKEIAATNKKMPSLVMSEKAKSEEEYNLKNLGDVTVKSDNGVSMVLTKNGKDIPMNKNTFNKLNNGKIGNDSVNISEGQPQDELKQTNQVNTPLENKEPVKSSNIDIPSILNTDYSKMNDVETLNNHINTIKETMKNTRDSKQLIAMNLQLFAAQRQLKNLTNVIRPNIKETGSKIVSSKDTNKFNFKNALNDFYTRIVDINKPISDYSKESNDNAYIKATNSKNTGGVVDHILKYALVDRKGKRMGYSLKEVVNQVPEGKENEFWEYMLHKHNVQRAAEGKNVYTDYDSTSSENAVKEFEKLNPELKKAGENVTKWVNKFMDEWGNKSGLISDDLWQSLQKQYPNYIPTNRSFTELEGVIEKANGKGFVDQSTPLSRATGSSRDIINPVENIMNLVNRTVRTAKYNKVGQEILNSVRKNPDKLSKFAEIIPEGMDINPNINNIVTVLDKGNRVNLQINNKHLLDALKAINKNDLGDINRNVKKATNIFKSLITTKNPLFALSNVSRDIPTYIINSKENNPVKSIKNLGGAFKDIVTNSDAYNQYKAVGGGGSNFFNGEKTYKSAKELRAESFFQKLGGKIEAFNNALESAPRLAEFKRTLKETGDIEKALFSANDVTTNFSRGGDITKKIDAWVPYLNASVQGLDKLSRQFKNKPMTTIAKGVAGVTSLSIVQNIINSDNENYKKLDNRTKDAYYIFPYGDKFIKIPKSREYGVIFGSLFERTLRKLNGENESFKGFANTVATNFSPSNPVENNIAFPYFDLKSNKDFASRVIVPQSMQDRSTELQYDEKTSEIAKKLGQLTKLSPKQIEYVIKAYTGVIGQFVLPITTASNTKGGSKLEDALSPITSRFTADPLYNNQALQDFYDNMQKAKTAAADKNFTENIDTKTVTHEEHLSSEFTKANKSISDLSKESFQAMQKGDMNKVRQIRQQIIDVATKANKYGVSSGQDLKNIPAPPGELKANIEEKIKYNNLTTATDIRKQADLIYKSKMSDEQKRKLLQGLVDKTQNMKQGKAPVKKEKPNPYDNFQE